jgi:prepilin-type N-terminal cleavage/methylation domain-containing protein
MNRARGFSLVEIAMVVAIALILLSLGLTAITN